MPTDRDKPEPQSIPVFPSQPQHQGRADTETRVAMGTPPSMATEPGHVLDDDDLTPVEHITLASLPIDKMLPRNVLSEIDARLDNIDRKHEVLSTQVGVIAVSAARTEGMMEILVGDRAIDGEVSVATITAKSVTSSSRAKIVIAIVGLLSALVGAAVTLLTR